MEDLSSSYDGGRKKDIDPATVYQMKFEPFATTMDSSKNFDEVRVVPTAHIGWGDLPVGSADPREQSIKPAYFEQALP
eukprot:CAMPEP_0118949680 /NCGR_PEP_ID=MMETSP1169-20130426/50087_1 /TAXON_ID=36882 /ORGANISM="Pyramimonas obovata, Strain CCMP722" /LENGTH=77 /DNA_ID=CAMNT_0006896371 /DNA_START=148 /DNA_END=378 /DNA_ORIENTATION=-